ncbi:MAG: CHASE sensor domain-containing protein, partial [Terriglobia bacterium]
MTRFRKVFQQAVKFQTRSITAELTKMNMLASAAALLLACASFGAFQLVAFRRAMVRTLSIQAQIVGADSVSAILFNDPRSAKSTLAALRAGPDIIDAEIYTPGGRPFAGYCRDWKHPRAVLPKFLSGQIEAYRFKNRQLVLVRRIAFQGKPAGIVVIEADLGAINRNLRRYAAVAFLVLVICLAAVFLLSSFIRKAIAQPILQLSETAKGVSREKNYSLRAPSIDQLGELQTLAESFNAMLAQIQERDKSLQQAHDELEQRVEQRTAQLQAANKELEAFSYSVSHDLRAPLRHIGGFSKLLEEEYGTKLDATAQHYLKVIGDGATNMGQLVDDLLNLTRIGRQPLSRKPADLNALVQGVIRELQPDWEGRTIDWRISFLPAVECDPGLMKLVFVNLLSNAIKYTRRRERAVIEVGRKDLN